MSVAIRIPAREDQTEFNLRVWEMVLADPSLAGLEQRFETDLHGHLIMTPPPGPAHGTRQFCEEDGHMRFFAVPDIEMAASAVCPDFPPMIPI